jgi:PAS domain S-box-containing protein
MNSIRILYIDDYPLDRALVRDALVSEGKGFEVIEADSRQQFERLLAEEHYDLVLSDFNILGFTGLQVLDAVQAKSPQIPVIIVTGTGSEEIAAEAIKRGAADYVIKSPQHIRKLPHTIQAALDQKRLRRERQFAIDALRASEQKYRLLFDHAEVLISIYDYQGTYLLINQVGAAFFGRDTDECIGKPYAEIHPNSADEIISRIRDVIDTHESREYEDEIVLPAGSRWLLSNIQPVRDSLDHVYAAQIISQDITERRLAENAKERSQNLLLALSKAAPLVQLAHSSGKIYKTIGDEIEKIGFHAAVLEITDDRKSLELKYLSYQSDYLERAKKLTDLSPEGYHFEITKDGVFDTILSEGEVVFCDPALQFIRAALPKNLGPILPKVLALMGIEQSFIAPLVITSGIVGFLVVIGESLAEADLPAIEIFANQAAIAIQNAQSRADLEQRGAELLSLTARLAETEDAERRRLARELHDQVGQSLALLNFNLNISKGQADDHGLEDLDLQLGNAILMVNEISQGIRDIMDDLRPSVLDDYGLEAALYWYADRYSERTGIQTSVQGVELNPRLSPRIENALFRITQEALANVARHAKANLVSIYIEDEGGSILLKVLDDGAGFEPRNPKQSQERRGWGLVNMRERAESVGAKFELDTKPGQGAQITVGVPKHSS